MISLLVLTLYGGFINKIHKSWQICFLIWKKKRVVGNFSSFFRHWEWTYNFGTESGWTCQYCLTLPFFHSINGFSCLTSLPDKFPPFHLLWFPYGESNIQKKFFLISLKVAIEKVSLCIWHLFNFCKETAPQLKLLVLYLFNRCPGNLFFPSLPFMLSRKSWEFFFFIADLIKIRTLNFVSKNFEKRTAINNGVIMIKWIQLKRMRMPAFHYKKKNFDNQSLNPEGMCFVCSEIEFQGCLQLIRVKPECYHSLRGRIYSIKFAFSHPNLKNPFRFFIFVQDKMALLCFA